MDASAAIRHVYSHHTIDNLIYSHLIKKLYTLTMLFLFCAFYASGQYITVWKTNNPGSSNSNQITIPTVGINYDVAWGEIGNPANNGTAIGSNYFTLTFPSPGTYQVSITPGSGTFSRIAITGLGDAQKLLEVRRLGNIQLESMENAYTGCTNLTITATDIPNLQNVTSMRSMFTQCTSLANVPGINSWNVSSVTDMAAMFLGVSLFNEPIGNWNVSNVTAINQMFAGASSFNQPIGT